MSSHNLIPESLDDSTEELLSDSLNNSLPLVSESQEIVSQESLPVNYQSVSVW